MFESNGYQDKIALVWPIIHYLGSVWKSLEFYIFPEDILAVQKQSGQH